MGATLTTEMPIIEARKNLTTLAERFEREPGAVAVTRRGRAVLAILPWEMYEAIVETLDILSDSDQIATLRKGIKEEQQGKAVCWEKVKKQF